MVLLSQAQLHAALLCAPEQIPQQGQQARLAHVAARAQGSPHGLHGWMGGDTREAKTGSWLPAVQHRRSGQ